MNNILKFKQLLNKYNDNNGINFSTLYLCSLYKTNYNLLSNFFSLNKNKKTKTIATYYCRIKNGGVEKVISNITKLWLNLGYKVILITEEFPSKEDYCLDSRIIRETVSNNNINLRNKQFFDIHKKYCVSTIVYHNYWNSTALSDLIVTKLLNIKFVLYNHASINHYFYAKCLYFVPEFVKFSSLCDNLIVLSDFERDFYSKYLDNVTCLINPIDVKPLNNTKSKNNYILWAGRANDPIKNVFQLTKICKELLKYTNNFRFIVVGEINESFLSNINEENLSKYFEFIGYSKDMERYYKNCKLFISTSSCETFPMSIAEACSHGLPVVMYELENTTISKSNGIISISFPNYEKFAESICQILNDECLAKKLGKANRDFITSLIANLNLKNKWGNIFSSTSDLKYPHAKTHTKVLISNFSKSLYSNRPYNKQIKTSSGSFTTKIKRIIKILLNMD